MGNGSVHTSRTGSEPVLLCLNKALTFPSITRKVITQSALIWKIGLEERGELSFTTKCKSSWCENVRGTESGEWITPALGTCPPVPAQLQDVRTHYLPLKVLVRKVVWEVRISSFFFPFFGKISIFLLYWLLAFHFISFLPCLKWEKWALATGFKLYIQTISPPYLTLGQELQPRGPWVMLQQIMS